MKRESAQGLTSQHPRMQHKTERSIFAAHSASAIRRRSCARIFCPRSSHVGDLALRDAVKGGL